MKILSSQSNLARSEFEFDLEVTIKPVRPVISRGIELKECYPTNKEEVYGKKIYKLQKLEAY